MAISSQAPAAEEQLHFGVLAPKLVRVGGLLAFFGLGTGLTLWATGQASTPDFLRAYLLAIVYFIAISLGGLFFVELQHLTRAGWSTGVRRIAELLASSTPVLMLMLVPVVLNVLRGHGDLYIWADPAVVAADELLQKKAPYLNASFFALRFAIYTVLWAISGRYFLHRSRAQDTSGDLEVTFQSQWVAAPAIAVFALTATFFCFDFVMSLEPAFFSTVFGVYMFAGAFMSLMCTLVLITKGLQRAGILVRSVNTEHFHDLGKFMFGFVFFWGYIGFSQYMLIWYGNIPEETIFMQHRQTGGWAWLSLGLLFGHFVIPFAGLLSRHIKRSGKALVFWAGWLLVMEYVDLYWLIMPSGALEVHHGHPQIVREPHFGVLELSLWLGVAGVYILQFVLRGRGMPLRPIKDPRLGESLAHENI